MGVVVGNGQWQTVVAVGQNVLHSWMVYGVWCMVYDRCAAVCSGACVRVFSYLLHARPLPYLARPAGRASCCRRRCLDVAGEHGTHIW